MNTVVLRSPAKLNLFLKVLSKRPDGFHDIETVFERISLSDELRFRENSQRAIRIDCRHPHVPRGPANLVYKAVRLIQEDLGIEKGVDIHITKRIPVAAGLAGGSSNAAAALLGLNRLWGLKLSHSQLVSYAQRLGSDVAFFLYDCPWALGTGRGDKIRKLNLKTRLWQVVVVPCLRMYSREVYAGIDWPLPLGPAAMNVLTKGKDDATIFIHHLRRNQTAEAGRLLTNDLEKVIVRLSPRLEKLKEKLKSLDTQGVMISGSGPAVFGITPTQAAAERIQSRLLKRFRQVFVVRTL